ncbi:MAG: hybrid sensor histidine kinase/response regulator [Deltaproteobacteria bacterium]|nr:hybrid sensor histidine kinase/response regulator [Deltaproteobacteria bacterium]
MAVTDVKTPERIARLEKELAAARRTIEALTARVEAMDGSVPQETGALARALAGMQRELARRTQSLEETEATYGALYESTPDPLLTVDEMGLVLACNRTGLMAWAAAARGRGPAPGHPVPRQRGRPPGTPVSSGMGRRFRAPLHATGWSPHQPERGTHPRYDDRYHLTIRDVTNREALEEAEDERRRMVALAELAGAMSRELNDPMSIVQGRLELLLELGHHSPEAVARHLPVALTHARRMSATLRNLRLVGRTSVPHLGRVFLSDVLEDTRELVGTRLGGTELRVDLEPLDLAVGGDAAMYTRVVANLVDRLIDFCGRRGRLEITGRRHPDGVVVRILGGSHMPPLTELVPPPKGDEAHLQESGLGVSLARTLVKSMGGRLEARSSGGRAMFEMVLPDAPTVRVRARPVEVTLLVVGGQQLLRSLDDLLTREGFGLAHNPDAEAALAELDRDAAVEGVVTELLLPGMSGLSLVNEIDRRHPRLRGRLLLVSDGPLVSAPPSVSVLEVPLRRDGLLAALGRRVRKGR